MGFKYRFKRLVHHIGASHTVLGLRLRIGQAVDLIHVKPLGSPDLTSHVNPAPWHPQTLRKVSNILVGEIMVPTIE